MSSPVSSLVSVPMDKDALGATVVTKTLDAVNQDSSQSADHDFQKAVLGAKADVLAAQFLTGAVIRDLV